MAGNAIRSAYATRNQRGMDGMKDFWARMPADKTEQEYIKENLAEYNGYMDLMNRESGEARMNNSPTVSQAETADANTELRQNLQGNGIDPIEHVQGDSNRSMHQVAAIDTLTQPMREKQLRAAGIPMNESTFVMTNPEIFSQEDFINYMNDLGPTRPAQGWYNPMPGFANTPANTSMMGQNNFNAQIPQVPQYQEPQRQPSDLTDAERQKLRQGMSLQDIYDMRRSMPQQAKGTKLQDYGRRTGDVHRPTLIGDQEYVMNKEAVQALGPEFFDNINKRFPNKDAKGLPRNESMATGGSSDGGKREMERNATLDSKQNTGSEWRRIPANELDSNTMEVQKKSDGMPYVESSGGQRGQRYLYVRPKMSEPSPLNIVPQQPGTGAVQGYPDGTGMPTSPEMATRNYQTKVDNSQADEQGWRLLPQGQPFDRDRMDFRTNAQGNPDVAYANGQRDPQLWVKDKANTPGQNVDVRQYGPLNSAPAPGPSPSPSPSPPSPPSPAPAPSPEEPVNFESIDFPYSPATKEYKVGWMADMERYYANIAKVAPGLAQNMGLGNFVQAYNSGAIPQEPADMAKMASYLKDMNDIALSSKKFELDEKKFKETQSQNDFQMKLDKAKFLQGQGEFSQDMQIRRAEFAKEGLDTVNQSINEINSALIDAKDPKAAAQIMNSGVIARIKDQSGGMIDIGTIYYPAVTTSRTKRLMEEFGTQGVLTAEKYEALGPLNKDLFKPRIITNLSAYSNLLGVNQGESGEWSESLYDDPQ